MTRAIDEFFDYLTAHETSVERIDRGQNTLYVRARDGRLVSIVVSPRKAAMLARRDGLEFLGGATRAERSFGLFTIHLDEAINSVSGQPFEHFELDQHGLPVPSPSA